MILLTIERFFKELSQELGYSCVGGGKFREIKLWEVKSPLPHLAIYLY